MSSLGRRLRSEDEPSSFELVVTVFDFACLLFCVESIDSVAIRFGES